MERSDDGQQFYTADKVTANNLLFATYNWKDAQVLTGTAWYRIKAVDRDGKEKYSSTLKLASSKDNNFTVYPNPVQQHQFTLQFATPVSGRLQASLYNTTGNKVWVATINLTPQTASRNFMLPTTIPPGVYALIVESGSNSYRQTLVVKN